MASALTREQWTQIDNALKSPFGHVVLLVDGYRLTLDVQPYRVRKYVIAVFVNGWMRGEWVTKDCEERRRFFRPREVFIFKAKARAEFLKRFGKRRFNESGWGKSFICYEPYWNSFAALRRHLIANNESIEVLPDGQA